MVRPITIASQYPRLRFDRRALARAVATLDAHHDTLATRGTVLAHGGELSLVFLSDSALAGLHARFLDDPTITDVITFEGDPALGTAGEICVSVDAAVRHVTAGPAARATPRPTNAPGRPGRSARSRAASRRPIDQAAFGRELMLYVVHGWLHLAGYDDLAPARKRVMRRAEAKALRLLEQEGVLPVFRLAR